MHTNNQLNITVIAGLEGGVIVYENRDGDNCLVFGGNLEEVSKYLHGRMDTMLKRPPVETSKMLHELLAEDEAKREAAPPTMPGNTPLKRAMSAVELAEDGE